VRVAVLVKQIPVVEDLELGPDGRLRRDVGPLEMNAYCRRAVAKGVDLARETGGSCVVISLGPPAAEDVLREAVAWGADDAVLVCDVAMAGSDTLATARALAAAVSQLGPFDLVLVGRNSLDADTGQVGPSLAEMLGLPFLAAVREISVSSPSLLRVRCERDDGWLEATVILPAVLSCAERLCEPAKMPPPARAEVPADRLRVTGAAELGDGPWGVAASRTRVGEVRTAMSHRAGRVLSGSLAEQVSEAVAMVGELIAPSSSVPDELLGEWPDAAAGPRCIVVLVEPGRERVARELLGAAVELAGVDGGTVIAVAANGTLDAGTAASWGADRLVLLAGSAFPQDVAASLATWFDVDQPWGVLAPGTLWGREVLARVAARLDLGLTGDATHLAVEDDRLVAWKPAFGGRMLAAIHSQSAIQLVTVRPGVLPLAAPRVRPAAAESELAVPASAAISILVESRDDDPDRLTAAAVVIGVGTGVSPEDYPLLEPLATVVSAEIAATRRVTDSGSLPHSRQVGITGRSISPSLYIAIGLSGKPNHMLGVRGAAAVLAINNVESAPVFASADVGIVGDWREVLPLLVREFAAIGSTVEGWTSPDRGSSALT
jgi:electron transfer flavoprotein alpha subunit